MEDLAPLPHGEVGLLRLYDLANLPTVLGVQTDHLGVTDPHGGFEVVGRASVIEGRVSTTPSDRAVGAMGDTPAFRLLESYVDFSIDMRMGRRWRQGGGEPQASESRSEIETAEEGAQPAYPLVVDELVAGTEDPEARRRAKEALGAYDASGSEPPADPPPDGGRRGAEGS